MADLIVHGGPLLTQDRKHPVAEALAVTKGKIGAVGAAKDVMPLATPGTRYLDLGGRTLIPAFNDGHAHIWKNRSPADHHGRLAADRFDGWA